MVEAIPKTKLAVLLVPRTMWGKNVRKVVATDVWETLRWSFGASRFRPRWHSVNLPRCDWADRGKCAVCGTRDDELHLHELWAFDDIRRIQKLEGLQPLCRDCHLSIHFGRAAQLGNGAKAIRHLRTVNGWSNAEARAHVAKAKEDWMERSNFEYSLDLTWLTRYVPRSKIHGEWLEDEKRSAPDRLTVIGWSRVMLKSDAIVLDCETTGLLSNQRAEIVEIAAVNMRGRKIFESRFKPRASIPKSTIEIHGITNEAVSKCPSFSQAGKPIVMALNGKRVIAYNAAFDCGMLAQTCGKHNIQPPDCTWHCAMTAYKHFQNVGRNLPLPGREHSAIEDARATVRLIRMMADSCS
jgi:DNA polymerase-3 subunit epsilon